MMYYGWLGGAPLATVRSHMNLKIIFQYHEACIEAYVLPSGHTADCRNEFIAPTQFRTKAHTLNMRMALLAVVCHNYQHQTMCPALDNTPLGNHRGSQCHPCLSVLVSLTTASTYWCQQHHSCVNPGRRQYNKMWHPRRYADPSSVIASAMLAFVQILLPCLLGFVGCMNWCRVRDKYRLLGATTTFELSC